MMEAMMLPTNHGEVMPQTSETRATTPQFETTDLAQKAYSWGMWTWIWNAAGCLVSTVPIALPIGILLTIITFFTGISAMWWGFLAYKDARKKGDDKSATDAMIGFVLGGLHMFIVLAVSIAIYFLLYHSGAVLEH
jgi:hypothetical protein